MYIELDQNVMSTHIRIMGDKDDWRSEIAFVYKRWEYTRDAGPLFQEKIIYPAMARVWGGDQNGQSNLGRILRFNIDNAIAAHLAWQLDELFKTVDDFKRPVEVVQDGIAFYVQWKKEEEDSNG